MKKQLVVVGGANGVGKTTFAYRYRDETGIDYLGADEILVRLGHVPEGNAELRAGKQFFRYLDEYTRTGRSVIIESTLSGTGLAGRIEKCRAKGYAVHFVYVFLDSVGLCKKRIELRVRKGGHSVPVRDVERRFARSAKNFRTIYLPLADTWQLLYNALERPVEVAIGQQGETMVLDDTLFRAFEELSE
jgi:predicted ABC-type ATPase